MNRISDKLKALRKLMKKENIQAYVIPTNGPHNSEYVADHWDHRAWISGFTGSAGVVVVTADKAGLWTDARYFQQGAEQLQDSGINLFKMGVEGVPDMMTWISSQLSKGDKVGAASATTMIDNRNSYTRKMAESKIKFVTTEDFVGQIWTDRPSLLADKVVEHDVEFAGITRKSKLKKLRNELLKQGADATLITSLDEIGWLLNLRGSDVVFNPVFYAYLWVEKKKCVLFVDPNKIDVALETDLAKGNIQIVAYKQAFKKLKKLSNRKTVALDLSVTNIEIMNRLSGAQIVECSSPTKHLKAVKNDREIASKQQS